VQKNRNKTCFTVDGIVWTASVVYWSEFLATDSDVRDRFLGLPDFVCSGFGTEV
jgi:hypothetical protein